MYMQDPIQYIRELQLQDFHGTFPQERDLNSDELQLKESAEQAFLNAKSVVSFVAEVSSQRRGDVLNSVLLAQLAANRKYPEEGQLFEWYAEFIAVLNNIGWVIEAADFSSFATSGTIVEVENAIVTILTSAFGASYVTIIQKTLDAIKSLSDSNGKLAAFERNTHTVSKGAFQIGIASEEDGAVALQLGTFMLTSEQKITRILFFNSAIDSTRLDYCSRKGTLNEDVYAAIRSQVAGKLALKTADFVAEIDI